MTATALQALSSHWRAHPVQLAMLLMGLMLATALWSGVQALNAQARAAYAEAGAFLGSARLARLEAPAGTVARADFIALRRGGWLVSPVLEGRATLGAARVTLLGIEPLTAPAPPGGDTGTLVTDDLAGLVAATGRGLGFAASQTLREIGDGPLPIDLRVAEGVPVGTVLVDIGIAQRLLEQPDHLSYLQLHPDQPGGRTPLDALAPHLRLVPPDDTAGDMAGLTDSFHLNLTAFGLLAFAVGLFIVHAAVGLAFEQRRAMLRTLRALGVPLARLMVLLAAELALCALVAGALGLALGYALAAALLPDVAASLRGLYGAPVPGELGFSPRWALAGMSMAGLGAAVAGGQSLWRLYRLPLLAPARPRAWARAGRRGMMMQGAAALGLAGLALGLILWADGLIAGFALLAALLLAAALAMPLVLAAVIGLAGRAVRGPVAQWFWADTRQQLPGLSLALMALMLALAANVGVSTMVGSFRATFLGWLDQRLVAELYVTAGSEAEAEHLRGWLEGRVDAVLPVWSVETQVAGQPVTIYGTADHATYRDHWPLIAATPDAWDRLADGTGVMVNEQLARRTDLWPGSDVVLRGVGDLRVAGVYSDYGNPRGQIMLGLARFTSEFPDAARLSHALRVPPGQVATLSAALQDEFGLPARAITDQAEAKALSIAVFERTFVVTRALNVLTLSVAALALLAALVTLSGIRLIQLAPLWALGLTRARIALLELTRMLLLAAVTAALALPVGLLLAQVLLAVINVQAFGWRLPLVLFPGDWLRLGLGAMGAVGLAAALPVWRLARISPAQFLKVFASAR